MAKSDLFRRIVLGAASSRAALPERSNPCNSIPIFSHHDFNFPKLRVKKASS